MRETKNITLPISGIVAEVVTFFTYSELKSIESALYKAAKSVRMVDGIQQTDIDADAINSSTEKAITTAVRKLTMPDGTDIPDIMAAIREMHARDGMTIEGYINELDREMQKK